MNTAQNWALIGVVGTFATGPLAAVFALSQGVRASIGDLRESMNTRFDAMDRRLDGLDRDIQVLFRDRP